jgi:hypothetical protein
MEFGDKYADVPLVIDFNGEGAAPVRGAINFEQGDGEVLLLTNVEGADNGR